MLLAATSAAEAQTYRRTTGKESCDIVWSKATKGQNTQVTIQSGNQSKDVYIIDAQRRTLSWHYVNASDKNDYTITLNKGVYTVQGKVQGKTVKRTEKSKGHPWYQNLELNGVDFVGKKKQRFECFNPHEAKFYVMQASDEGVKKVEGLEARLIRATTTGLFAGIWHCDYYFDPKTGQFVVYKAVEGGPGTPETTIKPANK